MLFNSLHFLIFLPIIVLLYFSISSRYRNHLLLLASYYFYSVFSIPLAGLLLWSTVVDFYLAKRIAATRDSQKQKLFLMISLVSNLGLLFFFKYLNLFLFSLGSLLGVEQSWVVTSIILPMGISFYTFQTLSYTIDVYRGEIEPTDSMLDFAVYVSFFPQLVAGPIMRGSTLLPQLQQAHVPNAARMKSGFYLCVWGLAKKTFIADPMGRVADSVFPSAASAWSPISQGLAPVADFSSVALLLATYAFALQIYCDFSAYSDVAVGSSRILGINLVENFRQPYLATSFRDFWRRWHISLSTWLRDYLYIPLGGSHYGNFSTYRNLMLTMVIGGLWHGANWTFLVWGTLHGGYLAVERFALSSNQNPIFGDSLPIKIVKAFFVFHLVCLAWIFFRSPSVKIAYDVVIGMFSFRSGHRVSLAPLLILTLLLSHHSICQKWDFKEHWHNWGSWMRYCCYAVLLLCAAVFAGSPSPEFIYFQF